MAPTWSSDVILLLAENYSKHPCLYNTKLPQYHNKHLRQKSLNAIFSAIKCVRPDTTLQEIKTKLASMRTQFGVESNKVSKSMKSGCSPDEVYEPGLWYYKNLLFLKEHIVPRKCSETPLSSNKVYQELSQDYLEQPEIIMLDEDSGAIISPCSSSSPSEVLEVENHVEQRMFSPLSNQESQEEHNCTKYDSMSQHRTAPINKDGPSTSTDPPTDHNYTPFRKRLSKKNSSETYFEHSKNVLSTIASALANPSPTPPTPILTTTESLASYISSSIDSISNKRLRIETTHKIMTTLMEAQLKDLEANDNHSKQ